MSDGLWSAGAPLCSGTRVGTSIARYSRSDLVELGNISPNLTTHSTPRIPGGTLGHGGVGLRCQNNFSAITLGNK